MVEVSKIGVASAKMIENPTGRTDNDLGAALQPADLRTIIDAAVHQHGIQCAGFGSSLFHVLEHLVDLLGQLAGGRHNERLRNATRRIQTLEKRQQKRARLARPGAGLHDEVGPFENMRNDLLLNGHERIPSGGAQRRAHDFRQVVQRRPRQVFGGALSYILNLLLAMLLALGATGQVDDPGIGKG